MSRKKKERAEGQGPRAKEEGQKAPRARYVDREHFVLFDGRCFQHLFVWTYVPDIEDFNALLYLCHDLMTDSYFQVARKATLERLWKISLQNKEDKKGE